MARSRAGARRANRRHARRRALPPIRRVLAGVTVLGAVTAVLLAGIQGGYPATRPQLLSGAAWLVSAQVGQVTLLDGSSAEIAAQVQVAARGERLDVVQQAATAYTVNRSTGTIRRVDGATFAVTPPATPIAGAREGLTAFAGTDALYALDTGRGVLTSADPRTLGSRGAPVPLATQMSPRGAALDDAGRLWVLDTASGDLVWVDHGNRRIRRGIASPGAGFVVLADGAPVVVDTGKRAATLLDPGDGTTVATVALDLRPGDRVQVSGSPHARQVYLVTDRRLLAICDLTATTCGTAVPLGSGAGDLGTPVETGGRLFVPDYADGKVWIVDLTQPRIVAQPKIVDPQVRFQLLVRDGVVFYNDPDSEHAGVIRLDGGVNAITKYDPKNPAKGLTQPGPPTEKATTPPPPADPPGKAKKPDPKHPPQIPPPPGKEPPPPGPGSPPAPPPPPPGTPPQIQVSATQSTAQVGQDVRLRVGAVTGPDPQAAQWTFGDGSAATGLVVTHRWATAQVFQVSVNARFPGGRIATTAVSITVTEVRPTLTVTVSTGGTVSGGGIACPGTCATTTDPGVSVTLTATPNATFDFFGWTGACSGSSRTCTVPMNGDQSTQATFRPVTPSPQPLPAPVLTSPANGATITTSRTATFSWQPVAGAVEYVAVLQQGGTTVDFVRTAAASASLTVPADGTYQWFVSANPATGPGGNPSAPRTITFQTGPPPAPVLLTPTDGAVFSNFPRDTTFSWQAAPGAATYEVEIEDDSGPGMTWAPLRTLTTSGTSITDGMAGKNTYRWRVTGIKADGTRGATSAWSGFTYTV